MKTATRRKAWWPFVFGPRLAGQTLLALFGLLARPS